MSSFVPRNIALARESSWFKVEQVCPLLSPSYAQFCKLAADVWIWQEADIQKHARRLVSQGKIEEVSCFCRTQLVSFQRS